MSLSPDTPPPLPPEDWGASPAGRASASSAWGLSCHSEEVPVAQCSSRAQHGGASPFHLVPFSQRSSHGWGWGWSWGLASVWWASGACSHESSREGEEKVSFSPAELWSQTYLFIEGFYTPHVSRGLRAAHNSQPNDAEGGSHATVTGLGP